MTRDKSRADNSGRRRKGVSPELPLNVRDIIPVVRSHVQRWLRLPNVTSVGIGREVDRRRRRRGGLSIQVTVAEKLDDHREIRRKGWQVLPDHVVAPGGRRIPVDVLQRRYKPAYLLVDATPARTAITEGLSAAAMRRRRLDSIRPGISISHVRGIAGTLGAIVFDKATGAPCVLSNFHVLQGASGNLGDQIVQPGPNDDGNVNANVIGEVLRSHVGLAGDCAVATVTGRHFSPAILELEVVPMRMAVAEIDDVVIKSGRTTGVTRGVVTRVGVVVAYDYGGSIGRREIGALEIGPYPNGTGTPAILSKEGDSGALWMIEEDGAVTNIAVGLHFALDAGMAVEDEHALACPIHSVCDKLDIKLA